jgi:DNA-binding transcriptional LysR family regulator
MPEWLFYDELAAGQVKRVLRQYEPEGLPISLTYTSRKFIPPKLKAVMDYLSSELSNEPAIAIRPL